MKSVQQVFDCVKNLFNATPTMPRTQSAEQAMKNAIKSGRQKVDEQDVVDVDDPNDGSDSGGDVATDNTAASLPRRVARKPNGGGSSSTANNTRAYAGGGQEDDDVNELLALDASGHKPRHLPNSASVVRRDSLGVSPPSDFAAEKDKSLNSRTGLPKDYHIPKKTGDRQGVMHKSVHHITVQTRQNGHSTSTVAGSQPGAEHKKSLEDFKNAAFRTAGSGNFFGTGEAIRYSGVNSMARPAIHNARDAPRTGTSHASAAHFPPPDDGNAGGSAQKNKISFNNHDHKPLQEYGRTGLSAQTRAQDAMAGRLYDPKTDAVPPVRRDLKTAAMCRPNSELVSGVDPHHGSKQQQQQQQRQRNQNNRGGQGDDDDEILEFDSVPASRTNLPQPGTSATVGGRTTNNSRGGLLSGLIDHVRQQINGTSHRRQRPNNDAQQLPGYDQAHDAAYRPARGVDARSFYKSDNNAVASSSHDDSDILPDDEPASKDIAAAIRAPATKKQPVIDFIDLDEDDDAGGNAEFAALSRKFFTRYDGPSSIAASGFDCDDWCRNNPWFQSMFSMLQCEAGWHCFYVPKFEADHRPMRIEARNVLCLMPPNYTPESTLDFAACYINDHYSMGTLSDYVPKLSEEKMNAKKQATKNSASSSFAPSLPEQNASSAEGKQQPHNLHGASGSNSNSSYKSALEATSSTSLGHESVVLDKKEDVSTRTGLFQDFLTDNIPPSDAEDSGALSATNDKNVDGVDASCGDDDGFGLVPTITKGDAGDDAHSSQTSSTSTVVHLPTKSCTRKSYAQEGANDAVRSKAAVENEDEDDDIICESAVVETAGHVAQLNALAHQQHFTTNTVTSNYFPADVKLSADSSVYAPESGTDGGLITGRCSSIEFMEDAVQRLSTNTDNSKSFSGGSGAPHRNADTGYMRHRESATANYSLPLLASYVPIRKSKRTEGDDEWDKIEKAPSPVKQLPLDTAFRKAVASAPAASNNTPPSKSIVGKAYDDVDSDGSPSVAHDYAGPVIVMEPPLRLVMSNVALSTITAPPLAAPSTVASHVPFTDSTPAVSFTSLTMAPTALTTPERARHFVQTRTERTPISGALVDQYRPHNQQQQQQIPSLYGMGLPLGRGSQVYAGSNSGVDFRARNANQPTPINYGTTNVQIPSGPIFGAPPQLPLTLHSMHVQAASSTGNSGTGMMLLEERGSSGHWADVLPHQTSQQHHILQQQQQPIFHPHSADAIGPPNPSFYPQPQQQYQQQQPVHQSVQHYQHHHEQPQQLSRRPIRQPSGAAADDDVNFVMEVSPPQQVAQQQRDAASSLEHAAPPPQQRNSLERKPSSSMSSYSDGVIPNDSPRKDAAVMTSPHIIQNSNSRGPPRIASSSRSSQQPAVAMENEKQRYDQTGRRKKPVPGPSASCDPAIVDARHIAGKQQQYQNVPGYQEKSGGGGNSWGGRNRNRRRGGGRLRHSPPKSSADNGYHRSSNKHDTNSNNSNNSVAQPKMDQYVTNNKHIVGNNDTDEIREEVHVSDEDDGGEGSSPQHEQNGDRSQKRSQFPQADESVSNDRQAVSVQRRRQASGAKHDDPAVSSVNVSNLRERKTASKPPPMPTSGKKHAAISHDDATSHADKSRHPFAGMSQNRDGTAWVEQTKHNESQQKHTENVAGQTTPRSARLRSGDITQPDSFSTPRAENRDKAASGATPSSSSRSSSAGSGKTTKTLMQSRRAAKAAAVSESVSSPNTVAVGEDGTADAVEGDEEAGADVYHVPLVYMAVEKQSHTAEPPTAEPKLASQEELVEMHSVSSANANPASSLPESQQSQLPSVPSSVGSSSTDGSQSSTKAVSGFPVTERQREMLRNVDTVGSAGAAAGSKPPTMTTVVATDSGVHTGDRKRPTDSGNSASVNGTKKLRVEEVIVVSSDDEADDTERKASATKPPETDAVGTGSASAQTSVVSLSSENQLQQQNSTHAAEKNNSVVDADSGTSKPAASQQQGITLAPIVGKTVSSSVELVVKPEREVVSNDSDRQAGSASTEIADTQPIVQDIVCLLSPGSHRSVANASFHSSPQAGAEADEAVNKILYIEFESRSQSRTDEPLANDDASVAAETENIASDAVKNDSPIESRVLFSYAVVDVQQVAAEDRSQEVDDLSVVEHRAKTASLSSAEFEPLPASPVITTAPNISSVYAIALAGKPTAVSDDVATDDMTNMHELPKVQELIEVEHREKLPFTDGENQMMMDANKSVQNDGVNNVSPTGDVPSPPQQQSSASNGNSSSTAPADNSDAPLDPYQHEPPILSYNPNETDWDAIRARRKFYCVPATLTNIAMTVVRSEKTQPDVYNRYSGILKKWVEDMAKHVNIFYLKALFLPFCIDDHYILLVVVNPAFYLDCLYNRGAERVKEVMRKVKLNYNRDAMEKPEFDNFIRIDAPPVQPCFLYLDSMKSLLTPARKIEALKCSLRVLGLTWSHFNYDRDLCNVAWTMKNNSAAVAPVRSCEPPQQVDSFNCGLFVIYFVERLMLNWIESLKFDGTTTGKQPSTSAAAANNNASTNIKALINLHLKPIDPEERQLRFLRTLWMRRIFSIRTVCSRDHVHALTMPAVDDEGLLRPKRAAGVAASTAIAATASSNKSGAAVAVKTRKISTSNSSCGGQVEELPGAANRASNLPLPINFHMAKLTTNHAKTSLPKVPEKVYDPLSLSEYFLTMNYAVDLEDPTDKEAALTTAAPTKAHPLIHISSDTSDADSPVGRRSGNTITGRNRINSDAEMPPGDNRKVLVEPDSSTTSRQFLPVEFDTAEAGQLSYDDGPNNDAETLAEMEVVADHDGMASSSSNKSKNDAVAMEYADGSSGAPDDGSAMNTDDGDRMDVETPESSSL